MSGWMIDWQIRDSISITNESNKLGSFMKVPRGRPPGDEAVRSAGASLHGNMDTSLP